MPRKSQRCIHGEENNFDGNPSYKVKSCSHISYAGQLSSRFSWRQDERVTPTQPLGKVFMKQKMGLD